MSSALLITILIGALAGWLASQLIHGHRLGLVGVLIAGVVGVFLGDWLFGLANVRLGLGRLTVFIEALAGAAAILFALRLARR